MVPCTLKGRSIEIAGGKIMARISLICMVSFLAFVSTALSQQPTVAIHIRLINGLNGNPWKHTKVGMEGPRPIYLDLSAQTDGNGVATIQVQKDWTIYTHNTDRYVACADEGGGFVHNDFKVSQILSTGIVQSVRSPNLCRMTTRVPVPGELVIFVRPWGLLERSPL
jgi:hypothetical protein